MTDQFPPQQSQYPGQVPPPPASFGQYPGQYTAPQPGPGGPVPPQQPVAGGQGRPGVTGSKASGWRIPVLVISALVLLVLGYGIGQSSSTTQKELTTARSQLKAARTQLTVARNNLTSEQSKVQQAQAAASNANANAAAKYKADEAKLAAKEKSLARTRHGLLALEGRVQASSISADGVYVVGSDIKPGTWHTSGDGGSGSQCYYATLGSTSTSDILDNNNFDGPETVDLNGAHAFQISGPCTWQRVG